MRDVQRASEKCPLLGAFETFRAVGGKVRKSLKAVVHFVRAFPTPTLLKKSYNRYDRSEARNGLGFIEEV